MVYGICIKFGEWYGVLVFGLFICFNYSGWVGELLFFYYVKISIFILIEVEFFVYDWEFK